MESANQEMENSIFRLAASTSAGFSGSQGRTQSPVNWAYQLDILRIFATGQAKSPQTNKPKTSNRSNESKTYQERENRYAAALHFCKSVMSSAVLLYESQTVTPEDPLRSFWGYYRRYPRSKGHGHQLQ